MFFELSKALNFFLVPSNIMVSLGLAGIMLLAIGYARAGRCMLVASIVLIAAVGVLPIGSGLALPLEERFPRWDATRGPPTGIVVLGGGVIKSEISADRGDIVIGDTFRTDIRGRRASAPLSGCACRVHGPKIEADFVVSLFEKLGVARDRVIVERASRNTAENAAFTKQLVMPKAGERWLLVTSAMHMPRAVGVFQKAGFAVDAYPVDYQTTGTKDLWTLSKRTDGRHRHNGSSRSRMDWVVGLLDHRTDIGAISWADVRNSINGALISVMVRKNPLFSRKGGLSHECERSTKHKLRDAMKKQAESRRRQTPRFITPTIQVSTTPATPPPSSWPTMAPTSIAPGAPMTPGKRNCCKI